MQNIVTELIFHEISEMPTKCRRMLFGGVRNDTPEPDSFLHSGTNRTFREEILEPWHTNPTFPCVIGWEKINGEQKMLLVEVIKTKVETKD